MDLLAFVICLIAACVFGVDAWLSKSLLALGLCLFVVGFICVYTVHGAVVS